MPRPVLAIAIFLLPSTALAQQPFVVDDAEVTTRGHWQVEAAATWDDLRPDADPVRWQMVTDIEVGYGLAPRLEVSALVPLTTLGRADGAATGLGDVALAAKFRLTRAPDARQAFAVGLTLELPTGSQRAGFGSSLTDVGTALTYQLHVTPRLTLRALGGAVFAGNTQTGATGIRERGTVLLAGGSVTGRVSPRVLVGAELVGARSRTDSLGGSDVRWQVGGNIVVHPRATLDWGVLRGESSVSPSFGVQVGFSLTFPGLASVRDRPLQ